MAFPRPKATNLLGYVPRVDYDEGLATPRLDGGKASMAMEAERPSSTGSFVNQSLPSSVRFRMPVSHTASSMLYPEARTDAPQRTAPALADARASALLGWLTLVVVLVVGAPLFLCMPLSFDASHYDICSRNLLHGGVHYRDTFDNNLPGIVWLQAGIRWLVGWRSESLHAVDLLFFTVDVFLLLPWVRRGVRIWTAVALFAFYLFLPEPCPCQRDIWMFLPAVVGLTLRRLQVRHLSRPAASLMAVVATAVLEGICWGTAVWIKPFVFVPALACWLVSLLQIRNARPGRKGLLIADLLGLLLGGVMIGAIGLFFLWWSGSWSYFWEIFLVWNRDYGGVTRRLDIRFATIGVFWYLFLPWSLAPCLAVFFAVAALKREIGAEQSPIAPSQPSRPKLALLAAFFLGWLFQALVFQLPHQYVLAVTVIPAVVLIAALYQWRRLPPVPATMRMCLFALLALVWTMAFQLGRLPLWAHCCREGSTPELRSLLAMRRNTAYSVDAKELADVERFLVSQKAKDGEVTCMSGCTHPLYLDLNLKPSTRFPQVEMTCLFFTKHRQEVLNELNASHQRFIVSDLVWTGMTPHAGRGDQSGRSVGVAARVSGQICSALSVERASRIPLREICSAARNEAGVAVLASEPDLRFGRHERLRGAVLGGPEFPRRRGGAAKRRRDRRFIQALATDQRPGGTTRCAD